MKITIRPDPDCIELIRSRFEEGVAFLKSVGIPTKDAENWEVTHVVEINQSAPPLVDIFEMKCYLPVELFSKTEWMFKFSSGMHFTSFVISGKTVCCKLRNTDGLICLPDSLLNLSLNNYKSQTLDESFENLKKLTKLKSISFRGFEKLKDIYLLKYFINLQSISLSNCYWLTDISGLSGLLNLQTLHLSGCSSLTDISGLSGLLNLQTLHLSGCSSLTDISSLSGLLNLQSLSFSNCKSLADISSLARLLNLQSVGLDGCESLTDISSLVGLLNLQSLDLSYCKPFKEISDLSGLLNLQTLYLSGCESLTYIRGISGLLNLQTLHLSGCSSLTDISGLSGLLNLQTLDLNSCESLIEINSLSGLVKLQSLKLGNCNSLTNISSLSGLLNLRLLDLSWCGSLTDISSLTGLLNLQSLTLLGCKFLEDTSLLFFKKMTQNIYYYYKNGKQVGPVNINILQTMVKTNELAQTDLVWIKNSPSWVEAGSLQELFPVEKILPPVLEQIVVYPHNEKLISTFSKKGEERDSIGPAGLTNMLTLHLSGCYSLTDISSLSGLVNLQSLYLWSSTSLTNICDLSGLLNLQTLELDGCRSLTDISGLSGLFNLRLLNLNHCESLKDISSLSGLVNLRRLNLSSCRSVTDISSLSGLLSLQTLDLGRCGSLTDLSCLAELLSLASLNLEECKRIQNYSSLRNCLALKELKESNMHPVELAELLCFLAVQRKDISFIYQKTNYWLKELELGLGQKHSSANDLACSLAKGIILANLANLDEVGLLFHQTLLNHPDVGIAPWKIWVFGILRNFGWDAFNSMAELNPSNELTFGAIAGIASCLPSMEGDPVQIAWAKKWISEIHSLHNNNPNFLKPAAAEWCLALKRLGEDELLRDWIEKFTDPSDPSALDLINKVFSAYALDLNDSESALEYALKINDPKPRDESILNLAQQFIKEGETTKAGEFLFLLTQVESRTQLAYSLAEDAAYLKNDENAHRLLAACGDNPQSLASILDKLRLANPDSEILKIMNDKLGSEKDLKISGNQKMQLINLIGNSILNINDSEQFAKIQKRIVPELNSN